MDCAVIKKKFQEAKTFAEAEAPLKEALVGPAGMELARTAFQIQGKQPDVAAQFRETILKEIDANMKKVQEASDEVGGDNRADPLTDVTKKTPDGGKPNTGATNTENQMKEDIMGMLHPDIASQMMNPNMPAMTFPQQVKQMQYTINKMLTPLMKEIKETKAENERLKEAVSKLDAKVQETTGAQKTIPLDVSPRHVIRETGGMMPTTPVYHKDTETRRLEISELNRMMNSGEISSTDIYQ